MLSLALALLISTASPTGALVSIDQAELAERTALLAEREKAQNRLVGDLAIHTAAALKCARQFRPGSNGEKCWLWGFGLEAGVAMDRQDPALGNRYARSILIGPSPLTFGSWYFREEHRFNDLEFGFIEPYALLRAGLMYEPSPDGEREVGRFLGLIIGNRSWVGWTIFRAGLELSYELGPPELARGPTIAAFFGLALHFAPTRASRTSWSGGRGIPQ
jgi:hypothetical protein